MVLALKFAAWWLTGSVALYSDALESVVNVATAVAALAAIRYCATCPPTPIIRTVITRRSISPSSWKAC